MTWGTITATAKKEEKWWWSMVTLLETPFEKFVKKQKKSSLNNLWFSSLNFFFFVIAEFCCSTTRQQYNIEENFLKFNPNWSSSSRQLCVSVLQKLWYWRWGSNMPCNTKTSHNSYRQSNLSFFYLEFVCIWHELNDLILAL